MQAYTTYFLNAAGAVIDAQPLHAETVDEALGLARVALEESGHVSVEVWQLATCLAKVAKDDTEVWGEPPT